MAKFSPEPGSPKLLTQGDVADVLRCSIKTVVRRISSGDLPVIRDGRMVRVHPDDLTRDIKLRREG